MARGPGHSVSISSTQARGTSLPVAYHRLPGRAGGGAGTESESEAVRTASATDCACTGPGVLEAAVSATATIDCMRALRGGQERCRRPMPSAPPPPTTECP